MNKEKDHKQIRIAIQGGFGAFHEIAATHYFNESNIEIMPVKAESNQAIALQRISF